MTEQFQDLTSSRGCRRCGAGQSGQRGAKPRNAARAHTTAGAPGGRAAPRPAAGRPACAGGWPRAPCGVTSSRSPGSAPRRRPRPASRALDRQRASARPLLGVPCDQSHRATAATRSGEVITQPANALADGKNPGHGQACNQPHKGRGKPNRPEYGVQQRGTHRCRVEHG